MNPTHEQIVEMLNAHRGEFDKLIGLRFTSASLDELVAEVEVGPQLTQPYGLVHGGVYATIVETLCSTGAAMHVFSSGHGVVGLDNQTSFLRATREGKLIATARPLKTGRRTHVWRADINDEQGRLLASGQVRLIILEPGAKVAGKATQAPSIE